MASDPYIEIITVLVSLMVVVLGITLLWFLVRKFVLGRSALKPAVSEATPSLPATQQEAATVASPAKPAGVVSPGEDPAAAAPASGAASPDVRTPERRSFGAVARRASVAVGRAVKQETAALLQSLSAGAYTAQVPTDDDFDNQDDNKVNKPGADAAPSKDDATGGTKAPSPSSDKQGRAKPSPTTEAAEKELQAPTETTPTPGAVIKKSSPGQDDASPAPPSSDPVRRVRDTEEQVPKEPTKHKESHHQKKRKKRSLPESACASPPLAKPDAKSETSTMLKRKQKRSPDLSPKPLTENAGKEASPPDAEQPLPAGPSPAHAQRRPSTRSKGSRTSRKSSCAKPHGGWSEDISPPASWAPEADGRSAAATKPGTSDASAQECSPPAARKPDPPTPPAPNMDVFSRERSAGD